MIQVLSCTNRPQARTLKLSTYLDELLKKHGYESEVLDLARIDLSKLDGSHYFSAKPEGVQSSVDRINQADGVLFVVPEYNGSFPGVLKYFIDHWKYPESFEKRPVAFVGLGGLFGGLRPVEHLMQVMSYRNAFLFPERVFIRNAQKELENILQMDSITLKLLDGLTKGFGLFIQALKSQKLDANSLLAKK